MQVASHKQMTLGAPRVINVSFSSIQSDRDILGTESL